MTSNNAIKTVVSGAMTSNNAIKTGFAVAFPFRTGIKRSFLYQALSVIAVKTASYVFRINLILNPNSRFLNPKSTHQELVIL
jgi:hypothetical protein